MPLNVPVILAIESSCDESALALFDPARGLRGEWVHTQIALHGEYGGVVPDLASREHLTNFPLLLEKAVDSLEGGKTDKIAVTCGPGLAGCLAIGVALGKSLALAWKAPLAGVNHLRGHAFSPFITLHEENPGNFEENLQKLLPHLGLIVSGSNTLLFVIHPGNKFEMIARTVDDAAGEALDKGAKLLGLGFPGGPAIEERAESGNPDAFQFPRAFYHTGERKFSFSGLKTSLRYRLEKMDDAALESSFSDLCASYQEAVVDALARKTAQVLKTGNFASLGLSGGVANNRRLRSAFSRLAEKTGLPFFAARPEHTGDNAAMIAFAAFADPRGIHPDSDHSLSFYPSLTLD